MSRNQRLPETTVAWSLEDTLASRVFDPAREVEKWRVMFEELSLTQPTPVFEPAQEVEKWRVLFEKLSIKDTFQGQPSPTQHHHSGTQRQPHPQSVTDEILDSKEKSTLMTLPRELRDMIYGLVLEDSEVHYSARGVRVSGTSLPFACQQIYYESRNQYYESTTFFVEHPKDVRSLYDALPEQMRPLVKDLRIERCDPSPRHGSTVIWDYSDVT